MQISGAEGEHTVPPGSRGVVDHVDDIGQIHMKWENGSSLALNVEEDRFDIITQQDEISEKKEQEFIDRINEILGKTDFLLLNTSCNTENTSYAAETLLAMHQAVSIGVPYSSHREDHWSRGMQSLQRNRNVPSGNIISRMIIGTHPLWSMTIM